MEKELYQLKLLGVPWDQNLMRHKKKEKKAFCSENQIRLCQALRFNVLHIFLNALNYSWSQQSGCLNHVTNTY